MNESCVGCVYLNSSEKWKPVCKKGFVVSAREVYDTEKTKLLGISAVKMRYTAEFCDRKTVQTETEKEVVKEVVQQETTVAGSATDLFGSKKKRARKRSK